MFEFLLHFGAACESGFFGFPTWYKYLAEAGKLDDTCSIIVADPDVWPVPPNAFQLADIWLIVAAVIEMAIYVAGIIAVVMIIWGGFRLIISQGNPDSIKSARNSVLYAAIGLVVSISARAMMNVVMGIFT